MNRQNRVFSRRSPWWQWHRGRQGPGAHGRELFSPVLVVAPDRGPIRVLLPLRNRSRYFVHVHLSRGDIARRAVRRGRNNLPGREMRRGDQHHRDTESLGARARSNQRALDQRATEISWVYYLRSTLSDDTIYSITMWYYGRAVRVLQILYAVSSWKITIWIFYVITMRDMQLHWEKKNGWNNHNLTIIYK